MLQFNLSKVDRVAIHGRIASGNITAKEISLMSSTDLANDETKQNIKIAEQEALEHSILQKTTVPRAKITHKGLQDIEDVNGELVSLRERERERERELEEEERRERERMARVRLAQAQRQRTASVSVPPESPVTPHKSPTWGAPPPVPAHAIASHAEEAPSPTSARPPPNPIFVHTGSELSIQEPELNLADIINIEDEASGHDVMMVESPTPASPNGQEAPTSIITNIVEKSQEMDNSPAPPAVTGISPFAAKPATSSFDLSSLWSGPSAEATSNVSSNTPSSDLPRVTAEVHKEVLESETALVAQDQDFDMFLEEKEQTVPSVPSQPKFEDLPRVWSGKVCLASHTVISSLTFIILIA